MDEGAELKQEEMKYFGKLIGHNVFQGLQGGGVKTGQYIPPQIWHDRRIWWTAKTVHPLNRGTNIFYFSMCSH